MSLISLFKLGLLTPMTLTVIGILVALSMAVGAIILHKIGQLRRHRAEADIAMGLLREPMSWEHFSGAFAGVAGPYARIVRRAHAEASAFSMARLETLQGTLSAEVSGEGESLASGLDWLSVSAAVAPLLGLLGTVTGIMSVFLGIHATGTGQIQAVAPGVAEALLTTAAGLVVAIPAAMAYQLISGKIRVAEERMDRFAADVVHRLVREKA